MAPPQASGRDKGKDPGSAFGPEAVPLATGLVSVVYWVPGPFQAQPPVQPDDRGRPVNPPARLASPWTGQQLTVDPGNVKRQPGR